MQVYIPGLLVSCLWSLDPDPLLVWSPSALVLVARGAGENFSLRLVVGAY